MIVFKFGGASVKDAEAVRNLGNIIKGYNEKLVVVVSAMGKTTNLLEKLVKAYHEGNDDKWDYFEEFKTNHKKITDELFDEVSTSSDISQIFSELESKIKSSPSPDYNFEYDQIICYGELLSTLIVANYLSSVNIPILWKDIRESIVTDDKYREANVNWTESEKMITKNFNFLDAQRYITQGFIGATKNGIPTSLGREGSDFTAAIIGNILNARYIAIWKDVPGVMNADPKQLEATLKIDELSYREAIEMSHSGAKIIHPKTIKPLQNKNIPLKVKSFLNPEAEGTLIHPVNHTLDLNPVYIIKEEQVLLTLSPKDFSFIGIDDISFVFSLLSKNRFKVNLFQQSAIDLSLVVDFPESNFENTIHALSSRYEVKYNTNLDLITIRYYTEDSITKITSGKKIFIEQKSRRTARLVTKKSNINRVIF